MPSLRFAKPLPPKPPLRLSLINMYVKYINMKNDWGLWLATRRMRNMPHKENIKRSMVFTLLDLS